MNRKIFFRLVTLCCVLVTISGIPSTPEDNLKHRPSISSEGFKNNTKCETVTKTENSLILRSLLPRQNSNELPSFFKSILNLVFAILNTSKTTLPRSIFYYINVLIVIGVCALTPYCNMVLENMKGRDAYVEFWPHVDQLDGYIFESINRYNELQSGVYSDSEFYNTIAK